MRLLLNLVENIFHKNDSEGRALLVRILHCLVCKFATLKGQIAKQLEARKQEADEADADKQGADKKAGAPAPAAAPAAAAAAGAAAPAGAAPAAAAEAATKEKEGGGKDEATAMEVEGAGGEVVKKEGSGAKEEGKKREGKIVAAITDSSALADPKAMAVLEKAKASAAADKGGSGGDKDGKGGDKKNETKEVKQMLKTMILGVKTVVWSVSNSRMSVMQARDPMAGAQLQKGMSEAECLLVARLLKSGLECFAIYSTGPEASPQEEKDVLDYFAGVFTVLDVRNFTQVFSQQVRRRAPWPGPSC